MPLDRSSSRSRIVTRHDGDRDTGQLDAAKQDPTPARGSRTRLEIAAGGRRVVIAIAALVVVGAIAVGVTDPFASPTGSSSAPSGNVDSTGTATVTRQDLAEQTQVNATLGYAGSYTVNLPAGTTPAMLTQDRTSVASDAQKVSADEAVLATARALAKPTNASTLAAAEATVNANTTAFTQAKAQLAADQSLGCPASSSATVTTPAGGTSAAGSGGGSGGASSATTASGAGATTAHLSAAETPTATTGPVDGTTNSSAVLTGPINPNGADTTYQYQYGTSTNYGKTTLSTDAGAGTSDVGVAASVTGLTPGVTHHYRLIATNSLGTSYGEDATFQTTNGPTVTTGTTTTASSTSETVTGTISPNGADTSYVVEYGTSSTFGSTTAAQSIGGGTSAVSISATITGLKANTTYAFALVATNALGTSVGTTGTFQTAESSCVAQSQVVTQDRLALQTARDALAAAKINSGSSVTSAEQTLAADRLSLTAAQQALSEDQKQSTNAGTTFTALPAVGRIISRGQPVYSLDAQPIPLFYGATTLYRALSLGVGKGPDVAEMNANLAALGFTAAPAASNAFTTGTESAVKAWQASLGLPTTGVVSLGDVVVEPGPIQVNTVTPTTGVAAAAGTAVLTATSTNPVVTIALDASLQSGVKVGDPVTITLPDNSTTPGVVSSVSNVATIPASSGSGSNAGSSTPTVTVLVTLSNPKAVGDLNQAPVSVSITSSSVNDVLAVPVDALLALAGGGYAVELAGSDHLVPVTLGLFDDAAGTVQVSGTGLVAGQHVVAPKL